MAKHPGGHVFYRRMDHDYPVVERGEGVYLYDSQGRRYIDGSGGPLVVNIGHGVQSVADAVARQAAQVAYLHGNLFTTRALENYSERLATKVPLREPRFYYLSSGSEAVETAFKFARQVQMARGEGGRVLVISRWGSYHGTTLAALAASGKPAMRTLYAPMFQDVPHVEAPYCYRCPFAATYPHCDLACARHLEKEILHQGAGRVAAFIAEPVGGATLGAIVPPDGYWELIRETCDRYGVLLIADEVLTGFGRTGTWFAMEQFSVQPEIITMAKGAAGGVFPLSITGVRGEDVEAIRRVYGDFNHGGTFSHHVVGAAAALATMDLLEGQALISRAAELGAYLGAALRESLRDVPCVGDVRGIGMMWAVEFVADRRTKEPFPPGEGRPTAPPGPLQATASGRGSCRRPYFADRVCQQCMDMGLLLYPGHGSVDGVRGDHLMVAPPFVVTMEQIDSIVATLRRAVEQAAP